MKIKATQNYWDTKLLKQVTTNEEYEVSEERAKEICDKKLATIIEEEKPVKKATKKSK